MSEKWVIIMDRRQDFNVTSTPVGKSGPSAQDRYCARGQLGFGGGAKKRRANENIEICLVFVTIMLHVLTYVFLMNCFGTEMVLCDLYLKRFDFTKGLLFDTFCITVWYKVCRCDH